MGRRSYRRGLIDRLRGRPARFLEESYALHWGSRGLPEEGVVELLRLIESIYGVPAGVLEPADAVELLTGPVPSRNWWRDHFHDMHGGDNELWLGEELQKKLRAHGIEKSVGRIDTIDALVCAWCGRVQS